MYTDSFYSEFLKCINILPFVINEFEWDINYRRQL